MEILDLNLGKIRTRDRESRLERTVFLRSFWFLVSTEADEVTVIKKISKQKPLSLVYSKNKSELKV
jgi:hypothetical protein